MWKLLFIPSFLCISASAYCQSANADGTSPEVVSKTKEGKTTVTIIKLKKPGEEPAKEQDKKLMASNTNKPSKQDADVVSKTSDGKTTVTIIKKAKPADTVATVATTKKGEKAKTAPAPAAKPEVAKVLQELPEVKARKRNDKHAVFVSRDADDLVTVQQLMDDPKLYLKGYAIDSFEFYYVPKQNDYVMGYAIKGDSFINDQVRLILAQAEAGDKIYFKRIYASDANTKTPALSGLNVDVLIK